MKKKGFTLIELIVVIAIIGVLAAILVPAMMGYVKKSKVTTNNTTAKSIYNAFNTSITDLDAADETAACPTSNVTGSGATMTGANSKLTKKVISYFADIAAVDKWAVKISGDSEVLACGVIEGRYTGTYPHQMDPDNAKAKAGSQAATDLLSYAVRNGS
jgi:type IV pilus assembly protein PilA